MDIKELGLTSREQKALETMGFDSIEKVALCFRDDLGLGKAKGDSVIQRAKNILANRNIREVSMTEGQIIVTLSDTSKATIVSVEGVLGLYDDLKREINGNRLTIFKPVKKPCSKCESEGTFLCSECGISLCEKCRYGHEHPYKIATLQYLEKSFEAVKEKAERLGSKPQQKQAETGDKPSQEVIGLAKEIGFSGFVNSFFAELEGNEIMKKALCCALFSIPSEPVHVLVMGDPAGGKTLAKDIIARKLGPEIELIGANTTRSGLVCNLATGEPGALTYSDGKIVLVDEFDKIPEQDIEYCLELLSNGKCSIHSARIHETLESHFIMIAFANPVETVFVKDPISEIGLLPVLLSRFALIVKAEELDAEHRKALLKRQLLGEAFVSKYGKLLLPWLRESRRYNPEFDVSDTEIDAYITKVGQLVERHRKTSLRRDMRMGNYARRIPYALARANFCTVNTKILKDAIKLIEESVVAWE